MVVETTILRTPKTTFYIPELTSTTILFALGEVSTKSAGGREETGGLSIVGRVVYLKHVAAVASAVSIVLLFVVVFFAVYRLRPPRKRRGLSCL
jgi:hypothetical protein